MGDEAILQVIMSQLRASLPFEITVFSRDAKDTMTRHKVERALSVRDLSRDEVLPEVEPLEEAHYHALLWWDLRRSLQARLDRALPGLQQRARRTNEIAVRLLAERRARRGARPMVDAGT